jgi:hypothetical protein
MSNSQADISLVEMADILAFNLTQTEGGMHAPRKMNQPDLSTKLKYVRFIHCFFPSSLLLNHFRLPSVSLPLSIYSIGPLLYFHNF